MKRDRIKMGVMVLAAACLMGWALSVGATAAYLTDNESVSNIFTVGKIEAELEEPDFPGNEGDESKDLVPGQEVQKDPQVTNTGENDMLVFMAVEVPAEDITLVADDGTKGEKGVTDLFWLKKNEDDISLHSNHFDENWIPLTGQTFISSSAGTPSLYVFGYGKAVAKGEKTTALFDKVQLKNIIENEVTPGAIFQINVNAYAIQASNILNENEDLTTDLDEANLEKIYQIYLNQSGS